MNTNNGLLSPVKYGAINNDDTENVEVIKIDIYSNRCKCKAIASSIAVLIYMIAVPTLCYRVNNKTLQNPIFWVCLFFSSFIVGVSAYHYDKILDLTRVGTKKLCCYPKRIELIDEIFKI